MSQAATEPAASPSASQALGGMRVAILGVGNMGEAILAGALPQLDPERVTVTSLDEAALARVDARYGVATTTDNRAAVRDADLVVVAVKPHDVAGLLAEIRDALRTAALGAPGAVVLSVAAGITTAVLAEQLPPGQPVVRAMPNTPAAIGAGVTGISRGASASDADAALAASLLAGTGDVVEVPEARQPALGALSGSGPAYVCYFVEALVEAGVAQGLSRELATRLVLGTVGGTASMLAESGEHPSLARERVTSPGGTTAAALHELDAAGVRAAIANAVAAAVRRTNELGGQRSLGAALVADDNYDLETRRDPTLGRITHFE